MVGAPGVAQAEVVLVGSSNIHFSEISKTKLRDLYTGQSQAVGDSTVLVIDRDDEFGELLLSTNWRHGRRSLACPQRPWADVAGQAL